MSPELPGDPPLNPEIARSVELMRIRDVCYSDLMGMLADPPHSDQYAASEVHVAMIREAAASNDVEAVNAHIESLLSLADPPKDDIVEACWLGDKAGSVVALSWLYARMAAETDRINANPEPEQLPAGGLLQSMVKLCAQRNMSLAAREWILGATDKHSSRHWYMTNYYLRERLAVEQRPEYRGVLRRDLMSMMYTLSTRNYPASFMCGQIAEGFSHVDEIGLAIELTEHFMRLLPQLAAKQRFQFAVQLGETLTTHKTLNMTEALDFCRMAAVTAATELRSKDPSYTTEREISDGIMQLELPHMIKAKAPAQAIAHYISNEVTRVFASLSESEQQDEADGGRPALLDAIDWKLDSCIVQLLERGDMVRAVELLGYVTTNWHYERSLATYLSYARTSNQIVIARPHNDFSRMMHPHAERLFAAAEAALSDDLDRKAEAALMLAAYPAEGSTMYIEHDDTYIVDFFEEAITADATRTLPLGRQLLNALLYKGYEYDVTVEHLSHKLIAAGDEHEPARAYAQILESPESYMRLPRLWRLWQLLDQQLSPGLR
jgi:hypothetical protein